MRDQLGGRRASWLVGGGGGGSMAARIMIRLTNQSKLYKILSAAQIHALLCPTCRHDKVPAGFVPSRAPLLILCAWRDTNKSSAGATGFVFPSALASSLWNFGSPEGPKGRLMSLN